MKHNLLPAFFLMALGPAVNAWGFGDDMLVPCGGSCMGSGWGSSSHSGYSYSGGSYWGSGYSSGSYWGSGGPYWGSGSRSYGHSGSSFWWSGSGRSMPVPCGGNCNGGYYGAGLGRRGSEYGIRIGYGW